MALVKIKIHQFHKHHVFLIIFLFAQDNKINPYY